MTFILCFFFFGKYFRPTFVLLASYVFFLWKGLSCYVFFFKGFSYYFIFWKGPSYYFFFFFFGKDFQWMGLDLGRDKGVFIAMNP